ncbi:5'-3' exonuclease [Caldibacillus lycopersici]|uniref:5'-3' exonuclease n=1 Tax=Perspicuibacillus lycopersici TaxID=1325689 RepID=A0AAE3IS70_9BACI|nr:5'-3' exonuclease [Perspicuibacillus lycopersici]MCU9613655.1 5'-3' exonuclease [Perspicuibacillus lycopersici]
MTANQPKLLLVDGMALLFRAFYATSATGQFMYNDQGIPTNAVNGFLKHMFTAVNHFRPTHLAVCWDMGSKTFRNELYDDYKGNRTAAPDEMIPQFDLAKEAAAAFSIPNIGVVGFEADDCLGTIATKCKTEADVLILTGDQDILQVIDDGISVALLKKGFGNYQVFSKAIFMEEKGYQPRQLIDVKGLTGDTSDHYPGVRGIGPKTAEKLIQQFGSVENILESLHLLTPSQRKKIEEDRDSLILSKTLAEIKLDVPLQFSLEHAKLNLFENDRNEQLLKINIKGMSRILTMIESLEEEHVG